MGGITGRVGAAGAPASGVEGIWCWGGWVWGRQAGRQAACSLGAVVPVVVDVDSSCDATDDEWDPSGDQIEPGQEWVGGQRDRDQGRGARCSEPLPQGLCPISFPL